MTSEQLTNLIVSIILFIIGITALFLLIDGIRRNRRRQTALGAALLALNIFVIIDRFPNAGITLGAFGALAVAVFAGLTLIENRQLRRQIQEREQRDRQENRRRENRDRKERLLNEIIEWARSVITWRVRHKDIFRDIARSTRPIESARLTHAHLAQVLGDFSGITGLNEYIRKVALRLDEGLSGSVEKLINDTGTYVDFLEQRFKELTTNIQKGKFGEEDEVIEKTETLAEQMASSASSVLVVVATMKSRAIVRL